MRNLLRWHQLEEKAKKKKKKEIGKSKKRNRKSKKEKHFYRNAQRRLISVGHFNYVSTLNECNQLDHICILSNFELELN